MSLEVVFFYTVIKKSDKTGQLKFLESKPQDDGLIVSCSMNVTDAEDFESKLVEAGLKREEDFFDGVFDLPIHKDLKKNVLPWLTIHYKGPICNVYRSDID